MAGMGPATFPAAEAASSADAKVKHADSEADAVIGCGDAT
jgi:hypothetical protein